MSVATMEHHPLHGHPLMLAVNFVVGLAMASNPWWIEDAVRLQPVVTLLGAVAGLVFVVFQVVNLVGSWLRYGIGAKPHDDHQTHDNHQEH